MGWYHYQCAEDGSCNVNEPVPCPDGTCPTAQQPAAATTTETTNNRSTTDQSPTTTQQQNNNNQDDTEEELYYATTPIFHLCQKKLWLTALRDQQPYFPPTFWSDGRFTRASCESSTLCETATHYYRQVAGEWLCLELDPTRLRQSGMAMAAQRAPESSAADDEPVQCLKVYGGIPTVASKERNVVLRIYAMQRDADGRFVGMRVDPSVPKRGGDVVTDRSAASDKKKKTRRFFLRPFANQEQM